MKKLLMTVLIMGTAITLPAQENKWFENVMIGGFGIVQYQASDQDGNEKNSFDLRMARVALEGRSFNDFYWKAQMQVSGTTKDDNTAIRLIDLFVEWKKYKVAKVKVGQFKRPFTFENPINPVAQGFMSSSQGISKLAGSNDCTGEQASNGRDIGFQLQGDLLSNAKNYALLSYQIGVFNGQGINTKDVDQRKDIIGGLWVSPVKGVRIGIFGWTGSRGIEESDANGDKHVSSLSKNRYALSGEYAAKGWVVRSEYIHSQGFGKNRNLGDKADAYYAQVIVPIGDKWRLKARYDVYREEKKWSTSKTFYEIGADYHFTKKLRMNLEYARVNDRSISSGVSQHNYNLVDAQLDILF